MDNYISLPQEFALDGSEKSLDGPTPTISSTTGTLFPSEFRLTGEERNEPPQKPEALFGTEDASARSPGRVWLAVGGLSFVVAILCYLTYYTLAVFRAFAAISFVGAWTFLVFSVIAGACFAVYCLLISRRYWSTREIHDFQQKAGRLLLDSDRLTRADREVVREHLAEYLDRRQVVTDHEFATRIIRCRCLLSDDLREALSMFQTEILERHLDQQVTTEIRHAARRVGFATAAAPRQLDGLIILWNTVTLVDRVATIYAGRPGILGTLQILIRAMGQVITGELVNEAMNLAVQNVSEHTALSRLSGRLAEGATNAGLMLRLGYVLRRLCRPLQPSPMSITAWMDDLWAVVKG